MNELLNVIEKGIVEYGKEHIEVIHQVENSIMYVSYSSINNSFAISDKTWNAKDIDMTELMKQLDIFGVDYVEQ